MDSDLALRYVTELNLAPGASLHLDSWSFNVGDRAAKHLSFAIDSLQVNSH